MHSSKLEAAVRNLNVRLRLGNLSPNQHTSPRELFQPQVRHTEATSRDGPVRLLDTTYVWKNLSTEQAEEMYEWEVIFESALASLVQSFLMEKFKQCPALQYVKKDEDSIARSLCWMLNEGGPKAQPFNVETELLIDTMIDIYHTPHDSKPQWSLARGTGTRTALCNFLRTRDCFTDLSETWAQVYITISATYFERHHYVDICGTVSWKPGHLSLEGFASSVKAETDYPIAIRYMDPIVNYRYERPGSTNISLQSGVSHWRQYHHAGDPVTFVTNIPRQKPTTTYPIALLQPTRHYLYVDTTIHFGSFSFVKLSQYEMLIDVEQPPRKVSFCHSYDNTPSSKVRGVGQGCTEMVWEVSEVAAPPLRPLFDSIMDISASSPRVKTSKRRADAQELQPNARKGKAPKRSEAEVSPYKWWNDGCAATAKSPDNSARAYSIDTQQARHVVSPSVLEASVMAEEIEKLTTLLHDAIEGDVKEGTVPEDAPLRIRLFKASATKALKNGDTDEYTNLVISAINYLDLIKSFGGTQERDSRESSSHVFPPKGSVEERVVRDNYRPPNPTCSSQVSSSSSPWAHEDGSMARNITDNLDTLEEQHHPDVTEIVSWDFESLNPWVMRSNAEDDTIQCAAGRSNSELLSHPQGHAEHIHSWSRTDSPLKYPHNPALKWKFRNNITSFCSNIKSLGLIDNKEQLQKVLDNPASLQEIMADKQQEQIGQNFLSFLERKTMSFGKMVDSERSEEERVFESIFIGGESGSTTPDTVEIALSNEEDTSSDEMQQ